MKALKDFTIVRQKKGPIQVLRLTGPLDESRYPRLQSVLQGFYQEGLVKILLDCDNLDHISATAIQSMAQFMKASREAEGEVLLVRVPDHIKKIIEVLGYKNEFKYCEQEKDAVKILAPDGTGEDETERLRLK